jgi:phage gp29-like protein
MNATMTRNELDAAVEIAQREYLNFVRMGKSNTKAAKVAKTRRDELEKQLVALDSATPVIDTTPRQSVLQNEIKQLRAALYQAGQANNAGSVSRINARLEKLYHELDRTNL